MSFISEARFRLETIKNNLLFVLDRIICGNGQVPAALFKKLSDNGPEAERLALGRLAVTFGATLDLAGRGMTVMGLSPIGSGEVFMSGLAGTSLGGVIEDHFDNSNGSQWSILTKRVIGTLGHHKGAVISALNDVGLAKEEIGSLGQLPNNLYAAELNPANIERWRYVLIPLLTGAVMSLYGDIHSAAIVAGLGLLSFPAGEFFYREANVKRDAKFRAVRSAGMIDYLKRLYREHIRMTDIINSISRIPDFLFAIKFLSDGGGNTLPALYGFKQGLEGLFNVLTKQRSRETSRRTTEIAIHLINILTNAPFIATRQRWREHISAEPSLEPGIHFQNGLIIKQFKAKLPSGKWTSLIPINLDIEGGKVKVLMAKSGTGKSITLMALQHLLEHEGSLYIVRDGKARDVHSLKNQEELAEEIVLITREGIDEEDRIVDLYKKYFMLDYPEFVTFYLDKAKSSRDKEQVQLAFMMADNLLEKEIMTITELLDPKIRQKPVPGVFPPSDEILLMLKEIRSRRSCWVNDHLRQKGGNLAASGIDAHRTISSISPGELTRLLVAVADAACKSQKRAMVILDEPVKDIDLKENFPLQLQAIKELQRNNPGTAMLIVSHEHVEELQQTLNDCGVVNLEQDCSRVA